jgi:hypothetical protein
MIADGKDITLNCFLEYAMIAGPCDTTKCSHLIPSRPCGAAHPDSQSASPTTKPGRSKEKRMVAVLEIDMNSKKTIQNRLYLNWLNGWIKD